MSTTTESLKNELEAYKQRFLGKADQYVIDTYEDGVTEVAESGLLGKAIKVGDKAPDFELKNSTGETVKLSDYTEQGLVVLTWYRGGWCPYCNLTLKALQNLLPEFKANGANLLALTPELPDNSLNTTEKNNLQFEVLTDLNLDVARQYNLVFKLGQPVSDIYKKHFDLVEYNGNDSDELPVAATYVIDQEGVVQYAFFSPDYRERAEPGEILEAVKKLRK
ncbi:MAG: peroxiredoxin-like family protein [Bacteroidota bacterium]